MHLPAGQPSFNHQPATYYQQVTVKSPKIEDAEAEPAVDRAPTSCGGHVGDDIRRPRAIRQEVVKSPPPLLPPPHPPPSPTTPTPRAAGLVVGGEAAPAAGGLRVSMKEVQWVCDYYFESTGQQAIIDQLFCLPAIVA